MTEPFKPGALYKIIGSKCAIEAGCRIKNMVYLPWEKVIFNENNFVDSCYFSYRCLNTTKTSNRKYMFVETLRLEYSFFKSSFGYVFYDVEAKEKIMFTKNKSYRGGKLLVDCFKKVV